MVDALAFKKHIAAIEAGFKAHKVTAAIAIFFDQANQRIVRGHFNSFTHKAAFTWWQRAKKTRHKPKRPPRRGEEIGEVQAFTCQRFHKGCEPAIASIRHERFA